MQTFLPYPDFKKSAACLDNKRLNRQIGEAYLIYEINTGKTESGYRNHPATRMWRGFEDALAMYINALLEEWKNVRKHNYYLDLIEIKDPNSIKMPQWLGDERLHSSHRANLLRKDAFYYGNFGWTEGPGDTYYWPV